MASVVHCRIHLLVTGRSEGSVALLEGLRPVKKNCLATSIPGRAGPQNRGVQRRRKVRLAAVLALVLVIVGWAGGDWFPEPEETRSESPQSPEITARVTPSTDESEVPSESAKVLDDGAGDHVSAPTSGSEDAPSISPATADRIVGIVRRIEDSVAHRRFDDALSAVRDARALGVPAPDREALDHAVQLVRRTLDDHLRAAFAAASDGRVLEAESMLTSILEESDPLVDESLADSLRAAGWSAMRTKIVGSVPKPAALPAGRRLRCQVEGRITEGVATDSTRSERVAVELESDGRVRWPIVARHRI
ncbi:MAG: hypothetical protein KDB80_02610, partial [Planctomycetes bacterium]|nr:hypothetical protein [Planctomycetota bacterium]